MGTTNKEIGIHDDYYYRLGRHQAVIELVEGIPKARPQGLSPKQKRDWQQGFSEMAEVLNWRRRPICRDRVA